MDTHTTPEEFDSLVSSYASDLYSHGWDVYRTDPALGAPHIQVERLADHGYLDFYTEGEFTAWADRIVMGPRHRAEPAEPERDPDRPTFARLVDAADRATADRL